MQSIRSLIFKYLISLVLAVFLSFSIFSYFYFKNSTEKTVVTDHARALESVVSNIDSNISAQLREIEALARLIAPLDRKRAVEKLQDYLTIGSMFGTIHWYDARGPLLTHVRGGQLAAYSPSTDYHRHSSREFVDLVKKVIAEKKPYFSKPFYSRKSGSFFHVYVLPVFKPGSDTVITVISAAIFPQFHGFDDLIRGLSLSQDNFIVAIDTHRNLILSNGLDRSRIEDTKSLTGDTFAAGGNEYRLLHRPLASVPLTVTLGLNSMLIREKISRLQRYMLILGIVGVLLATLLSFLIADKIAVPFQRLARGIANLNDGVFSEKISAKTRSEIDQIYEQVNEISDKVEKARYLGVIWSQESEPISEFERS